jgi:pyruvate,orthophosphate dikinase
MTTMATKPAASTKRSRSAAAKGGPKGQPGKNAPAKKDQPPKKMVYAFGRGLAETVADGRERDLLGGKGTNLAEMSSIGLPVPPGFTITTAVCAAYETGGGKLPKELMTQVRESVAALEASTGKTLGSEVDPLLVSVRSGAAVSMPGMMDTVLNLGLNDRAVTGLIESMDDARFAYDAYRRLINMFGDVVMGVEHHHFEAEFDLIKKKYKVEEDTDVPASGLRALCEAYKKVYERHVGETFPQDPYVQLRLAIEAVFKSWSAPRAQSYRRINRISGLEGTAVNVQTMVFGNMGNDSGTGVAFTRNPSTGDPGLYGEFLVNAQGEDVVAGIRTPRPIKEMPKWSKAVHAELLEIKKILEKHYRDMQDIEFTIERGYLYMLQTRSGKRTGAAAVRIAVDMVKEKLITREEAIVRLPAEDLTQLLLPSFSVKSKSGIEVLTTGLPASPGAATGRLSFTADGAVDRTLAGEKVLLVRKETSPEDVEGMHHAVGILTSTGGMTSHAAVVARGWGKCCVAGAGALEIDAEKKQVIVNGRTFGVKDTLSIDGSTGEVMVGDVPRSAPKLSGDFTTMMKWADQHRRLGVRTNADSPADARRARAFGAEGIGLTRTEHMFFDGDRITAMREMILAEARVDREAALAKLLPFQRKDFVGIFTAMKGCPVTIRLLDPPLHEFLPHAKAAQSEIARELGVSLKEIQRRVSMLQEANPMLGHRGCRLAVTYPEILEMQVTAIIEAMIQCRRKKIDARPEIMIPLVGTSRELATLRERVEATIECVRKAKRYNGKLDVPIGTMIEIPRAALTADQVAEEAEFFSFGTNDLTQLAFGYSRDDINTFLPDYIEKGILPGDPFQSIDIDGVGQLVKMACAQGRATRPDLKLGICGEHGGDPASIHFFHGAGLDYVSCSPFRVPIARLVAAQVALAERAAKRRSRGKRSGSGSGATKSKRSGTAAG